MGISNVAIRPMKVYLGSDVYQVQKITCRSSASGNSLGGKYFLFHDSAGAKRYAWFDTGSSVDPAPAGGWTGHTVVISDPDSASEVATALTAVLTAVTGFDATASGAVVTLTHTAYGYAQPARDALSTAGTGFNFQVSVLGSQEVEAGCIDGDIEISGLQPNKEDILCHHSGTTVRGQIISGYPLMEVALAFKETDIATLKKAFVASGHYSFTPTGTDGAEMFGYGVVQVGQQIPTQQMRFHPVAKVDSDKSEDVYFWKTELMLDTLTYSGESIQTIPVSFSVYPDETKNKEIQFFAVGDGSQSGLGV